MRPATSKWNRKHVNLVLTTFLLLSVSHLCKVCRTVWIVIYWVTMRKGAADCLRTGFCYCCFIFFFSPNVDLFTCHLISSLCVCANLLQSCPTLCNPLDCSPPGSSVHGILQARILEWVTISVSRGSSWPRDRTQVSYVSCTAGRFFTSWAFMEEISWF